MRYQIKRNEEVIFEHEFSGVRTQSLPAIDFIEIQFDYYKSILLKNNDTLMFEGQTYYCDRQFFNIYKNSKNLYTHTARFLSVNYHITNIAMLNPQGQQIFEIEGDLQTLLDLAIINANRGSHGVWSAFPAPNTVTKLFQISNENVMSFLARVSGEFEIPFYINNRIIRFGYPIPEEQPDMAYGKGFGFLDLRKSYKTNEKAPNVVYANGADDLILGSPVIDALDIVKNGYIEGFYSNDRIKPTTQGRMQGTVTANNVVTSNLSYNINDYKIQGQTPIINFETGALGGYSFFIDNVDYINNLSIIYIRRRTPDGVLIPNDTLRPLHGDYFNITNITLPQEVINNAINKLFYEAERYMQEGILKNLNIEAKVDPLSNFSIHLGNRLKIEDSDLNINDYFIINEIRKDLQNLNKVEIVLNHLGRYLTDLSLPVKNDNIIDLGISNNYDELVKLDDKLNEEVIRFDREIIDIRKNIRINTDNVKINTDDIIIINTNKVDTLKNGTKYNYPNVPAVLDGIKELKDNLVKNDLVKGRYNLSVKNSKTVLYVGSNVNQIVIESDDVEDGNVIEIISNDKSNTSVNFTDKQVSITAGDFTNLLPIGTVLNVNGLEKATFFYNKENNVYIATKHNINDKW